MAPAERLPDTVQAAIAARIDLLPPEEKRTLQIAAVLGHTFAQGPLEDLLGRTRAILSGRSERALVEERTASDAGHLRLPPPADPRCRLQLPAARRAGDAARAGGDGPAVARALRRAAGARRLPPRPRERARADRRAAERGLQALPRRPPAPFAAAPPPGAGPSTRRLPGSSKRRRAGGCADRRRRGRAPALARRSRASGSSARPVRRRRPIGDPRAAGGYARAVEIGARMSGISGQPERRPAHRDARARAELVTDDDLVTKAQAAASTRPGSPGRTIRPWRDGAARPGGPGAGPRDRRPHLLQTALDAVTASDWQQGRHRAAVEHTGNDSTCWAALRERRRSTSSRSDALHMMIECLLQTGDFHEADLREARGRDLDLCRGVSCSAYQRELMPAFLLGNWDGRSRWRSSVREGWDAGQPPIGAFATPTACPRERSAIAATKHGRDWIEHRRQLAPRASATRSA